MWTAWCYLAAGLVVIGVYYLLGPDGQNAVYVGVGSSATAAAALAAARAAGRARLIWLAFAAGLGLTVAADTVFDYSLEPYTTPAVSDYLYLLGYIPLAGGVLLLVRARVGVDRAAAIVDAAIAATAIALVEWVYVTAPLVARREASVAAESILLAYPALDVVLLLTLSRFLVGRPSRNPSYWLVTAAVLAWVIADQGNAVTPAIDVTASWADVFWLASYLLWGAAALLPPSLEPGEDVAARSPALSRWRVSPLVPALAAVPVIAGIEASHGRASHLAALAIGAGALVVLVVVRVFGLLAAAEELRRSEHRARAEAEQSRRVLAERNRRLEELDSLKDRFVASVRHELRTPLTSILGNVELALEDAEAAGAGSLRRSLRVIARNAERLAALIDDLLFVAQAREQEVALSLEPVDVAGLALGSVEAFSAAASRQQTELVLRADAPAPRVLADPLRIGQLLDTVIDNALKFTRAGRVEVRVRRHGDGALIEVADTGIGVGAEDGRQLFEPFYRGANAIASGVRGTGLGLSIAGTIVQAHGGTIELAGGPSRGTVCTITLPAAPPRSREVG